MKTRKTPLKEIHDERREVGTTWTNMTNKTPGIRHAVAAGNVSLCGWPTVPMQCDPAETVQACSVCIAHIEAAGR